jgi:hypothetical protein
MLRRIFIAAGLCSAILLPSGSAHAQGCIMCYESALAAGKGVEDALRGGVLLLLVPVATLLIGIAVMAWRKRAIDGGSESRRNPVRTSAPALTPGRVLNSNEV